jgi:hypothetical protein
MTDDIQQQIAEALGPAFDSHIEARIEAFAMGDNDSLIRARSYRRQIFTRIQRACEAMWWDGYEAGQNNAMQEFMITTRQSRGIDYAPGIEALKGGNK